ncbi:tetratricopeptide repeat protein [Variovorax sp. ZT4R33]|uniref:tetratricopeptide repeat protein n=1 Tax=Variovorax sp. ZT4R33 TaxID=3443743 RepID=UPI003F46CA86
MAALSSRADAGDALAAYEVANHHSGRTGQALDLHQAFRYLERAAQQGHVPAQADLGFVYFNGNGSTPKDLARSFHWFQRAADGGSVIAQCMVGDFYRLGLGGVAQDARKAFGWYQRTATQPDRCAAKSQYALYASYVSGNGVRKDVPTAMSWLKRAANAGNPQAQRTLGQAYESGNGVRRDPALARVWLLKSREGVAPHDDHVHEDASQPAPAHRGHAH